MNTDEWVYKNQAERKTDERVNKIVNSNLIISKELNSLRLENAKLVEENRSLAEELKKQNEIIKTLRQPKWQFWASSTIALIAAIAAIISCFLSK